MEMALTADAAPRGLMRPPFPDGLAQHALVAVRHDDPSWEHPYFLGLVVEPVARWSEEASIEVLWLDNPRRSSGGWEYEVTKQGDSLEANMVLCQLREISGSISPQSGTPRRIAVTEEEDAYVRDIHRETLRKYTPPPHRPNVCAN